MKTILAALLVLCSALSHAQGDQPKRQTFIGLYYVHTSFNYPMHSEQLWLDILKEDHSLGQDLSTSTPAYIPEGHSDGLGLDWTYRKIRRSGAMHEWRIGLELIIHRQGSMHHREYIYTPTYNLERHINLVHHERMGKIKLEYLKHPAWWRSPLYSS